VHLPLPHVDAKDGMGSQLETNRRNALKSTGPRTINGKEVSRRNALRRGLTAETLVEPLEDPESYRAFEAAILAEYLPQSPVENELVHLLFLRRLQMFRFG